MNLKGNLYNRQFNRRAQAILEYAVLVGVIVAALIAMQVYFRRGLQGKVRGIVDEISGGTAYSPGASVGDLVTTKEINESSDSVTEGNRYDFNFLNRQKTTSTSDVYSTQMTVRDERTLSFGAEPERL